jgi:carboxylate-amine ligase
VSTLFASYPGSPGDEAVDPDGRLRDGWSVLAPVLDRLGTEGLASAATALSVVRRSRGITVGGWSDGRHTVRPLPMDPVPRLLPAAEWATIAAGVSQRHRALNAFLADAYRAAGRRRGDADRAPLISRAGVLPEWAVNAHPSRNNDAIAMAWPGQPRVTLAATDLVRTTSGWTVVGDDLRTPWGLGFALAARENALTAVPGLFPDGGPRLADPWAAVPLLRHALEAAAPPTCSGTPRIAVLSVGESDSAWFEHGLLARAVGVPLVRAGDIWTRMDGGLAVAVEGERLPVDVVYLRFADAELSAHRTALGQPLDVTLSDAVRLGQLGLANVPGNGLADDAATFAFVPEMIAFYLQEVPRLESVPTWVLADDEQWASVRTRLDQLEVRPLDGYGGTGTVHGPSRTAAQLASLEAEVAAAPHRFVAQEPVEISTAPTLVDGSVQPRGVGLRVFSVVDGGSVKVLPAPLTRVALGQRRDPRRGGGTKDTWLLG